MNCAGNQMNARCKPLPIPKGTGNALVLDIEAEHVSAIFTGFGERGRPAEEVAQEAIEAAKVWLAADVPVDGHLGDQLLLPMALAGRGSFRTTKPSLHLTTNVAIIQRFLPILIEVQQESDQVWRVFVGVKPWEKWRERRDSNPSRFSS